MKSGVASLLPDALAPTKAAGGTQAVSVSPAPFLIRDALLDPELAARQHVRDSLAGVAVAVDRFRLVAPVLELTAHGLDDRVPVVTDVDHVRAALPAFLAGPDVHGRSARKGPLADGRARVPDEAGRLAHQLDVVVRRQVLEEVQLRVVVVL